MINKFWAALISGIHREAVKKTFFQIADVQIADDGSIVQNKHKFELNGRPTVKVLFIAAQAVFDEYAQDIRRQGLDAPLSKTDIQREICKETYFIPAPNNATRAHRVTFGEGDQSVRQSCWAIRLHAFPIGQEIADALGDTLED
jgi:hypothetical protein